MMQILKFRPVSCIINEKRKAGERMKKIPISLIIDDPAPRVSVYYEHAASRKTSDGRPLVSEVPNAFLFRFCDTVSEFGLKGKFSIVPMPGGRGDVSRGIPGFEKSEIDEWLSAVKNRIEGNFSICPEMLTHASAVNLETNGFYDMNENDWSAFQTTETFTPYISKALEILKRTGFTATGVTSPWAFGSKTEPEYVRAISLAFENTLQKKEAWYFLHCIPDQPSVRPKVVLREAGRTVVSIPATTDDFFWQTINCPDTSDAYVSRVADSLITEDGKGGKIIEAIQNNTWPVILTHWQSLNSNGLETGLKALRETARRIRTHLSGITQWTSFEELMHMAIDGKTE